ncbi:hypothetical protein [Crocosphaera chwakensis]|uniref:Uncharacterized protein n=1 Tax=Crocosphaera chwakensis CCY0110 TaxID=391612 RepID=A3IVL5_9CHRO|nr:hypothetical protein [Crocosphaera chwakensis]EAZ89490.1 hypothetical protein CY0110_01565 [Crocosphaera chwakensis CCY0110]
MALKNSKLRHLIQQKPKWNNLPTKAVRVPECLVEEITTYAHRLDQNTISRTGSPRWLGIKPSISKL